MNSPVDHSEVYKELIPVLEDVGRSCGYAMAVHGSLKRDLDVVAIPWTHDALEPEYLVHMVTSAIDGYNHPHNPLVKPHGRKCWSIHLGPTDPRYIDLSVMPRYEKD